MEIDNLAASLVNASLGNNESKLSGVKNVYISEISSLSRLWIQLSEDFSVIDEINEEMR
jgi:hypothetical protein